MKRARNWLFVGLIAAEIALVRTGALDLRQAVLVVVLIEAALALLGIYRAISVYSSYRRSRAEGFDFWHALEEGLASVMPRPVAHLVALEPRMWYCLGRWLLRRTKLRDGEFAYSKRSPLGSWLLVILFATPAEIAITEILVPWEWLRLLLAIGALYSLAWLCGFYASMAVLPHRLEDDVLILRYGFTGEARIPYSLIEDVTAERSRTPKGSDGLGVDQRTGTAHFGVGGRTDVRIALREPVTALRHSPRCGRFARRVRQGAACEAGLRRSNGGPLTGVRGPFTAYLARTRAFYADVYRVAVDLWARTGSDRPSTRHHQTPGDSQCPSSASILVPDR